MSGRRLAIADLTAEISASLLARPARLALTAVGTVLGIGALVATLGLTATAGNHIVTRFDQLAATQVLVKPAENETGAAAVPLPWDAPARIERLNGVNAAGTYSELDLGPKQIRALDLSDPMAAVLPKTPLVAGSPGLFGAVRATLDAGRWFDTGHSARRQKVAVVGRNLADPLNLTQLTGRPAIFIGDQAFTVIGILGTTARQANLADAVIIPDGTARDYFALAAPTQVWTDTAIGAARQVAGEVPYALAPQAPDQMRAEVPPEPALVRAKVGDDIRGMLLLLGSLSLIVGGVGIANTTLVSVLERRGEIALRRSLGAQRTQIMTQFLLESAVTGLLGGTVGAAAGVIVTVTVAFINTWTPVLEPSAPLAGVAFGSIIGVLAGLYPAIRAARFEPIQILRGGV